MVPEKINFPVIIQARLSSQRLPNKVLKKINGIPLIEYSVNRIKTLFKNSKILIATSNHPSDDALAAYCLENNINFYRGSLNNVAKRMFYAAKKLKAKSFVRISGDSPLIDPKVVAKGIRYSQNGVYDLVTNIFPRSYPSGQSVEIICFFRAKASTRTKPNPSLSDDKTNIEAFLISGNGFDL